MKKTYSGSCHCGDVRFEADIDLRAGTSRCNCSMCMKTRYWKTLVPADAFRLLAGGDRLSEYQFGSKTIHHLFCSRCGVKPFGRAHLDLVFQGEPLRGEFYAVNVACLDNATDREWAEAPVRYEDGRHDQWEAAPSETRHL
jgi:hypothetical protein